MKLSSYYITFISAILIFTVSCGNARSDNDGSFEKLVQVYQDSISTFDKCEEIVLRKWTECLDKGVIQADAVAATVASESYLDGAVSEGVGRALFEIVSRDSTQINTLATILNLQNSGKYEKTAEQLAELFFFESLCTEVYKDGGCRRAKDYINDMAKHYPSYHRFITEIGIDIKVINGLIYFNGRKIGVPTDFL